MNYEGNFFCWTVICKTKECGQTLFLDVIGPAEKYRRTRLPPFAPFNVTCEACKTEYSYGTSDVEEQNLKNPPRDYRCKEFLDALRAASDDRQTQSNT
jgi:hypothetical protein